MAHLYKSRPITGQSFIGAKICVVPNQSMTLREILKRFVKHEALPVVKEGVYSESQDIDLEKFAHEDITVREEIRDENKVRVDELKKQVDKDKKSAMEKAKAKKREEEEELYAKWETKQKDAKQSKPAPPLD